MPEETVLLGVAEVLSAYRDKYNHLSLAVPQVQLVYQC